VEIVTLVVGEIPTNCYLVGCQKTGEALVIDPGAEPEKIKCKLQQKGWQVRLLVITHGHGDHLAAGQELDWPIAIHPADARCLLDPWKNLSALFGAPCILREPQQLLEEGQTIVVGDFHLEVVHTPGHTPGSICLLGRKEKVIFTGDTLFAEGVGRTDLPGGCEQELWSSLQEKLLPLDGDFTIYPGHGPATSLSLARSFLNC